MNVAGDSSTTVGATREVKIGDHQLYEQLVALDDEEHVLKWRLVSHPNTKNPFVASFINYLSTLRLEKVTMGGSTFVDWRGEFFTEPQHVGTMKATFERWYITALTSLQEVMRKKSVDTAAKAPRSPYSSPTPGQGAQPARYVQPTLSNSGNLGHYVPVTAARSVATPPTSSASVSPTQTLPHVASTIAAPGQYVTLQQNPNLGVWQYFPSLPINNAGPGQVQAVQSYGLSTRSGSPSVHQPQPDQQTIYPDKLVLDSLAALQLGGTSPKDRPVGTTPEDRPVGTTPEDRPVGTVPTSRNYRLQQE
eukprot:jgi/Botrbrau1/14457/Bobra.0014s0099.2